jgi:hypothetical protein
VKKIVFTGFLMLITLGAFCQIDIAAGGQLGLGYASRSEKYELDPDNYLVTIFTDTFLTLGIFADATYARLSLDYAVSLDARQKTKIVDDGDTDIHTTDPPVGYTWSLITIELLGKYPIDLGTFVVWPAAGFLYTITINLDNDGDGEADDLSHMEINDIYLSAGAGVDVTITPDLFATGSVIFNYNLTPNRTDHEPSEGYTWSSWMVRIFLGAGYKLASM